jgi:hypothetical protein
MCSNSIHLPNKSTTNNLLDRTLSAKRQQKP